MITLKETLKKLNLELDLPDVQYEYPMMANYESYQYKTINGQKCIEMNGFVKNELHLKCIINLNIKMIKEYLVDTRDESLTLLSSMDKEGVMPFH